ncbi:MAG: EAL domain-containing protein [Lachnospiraceae bacterium]|nr:EAL domain-containing protein [Lachnospiraceae bacterium]
MWDLSFAMPALLILLIILAFYFSLPRLNVRRNRVFLYMVIVETLVLVSDIVSSHMDNHYEDYDLWLVTLFNMLYFIFFYTRALVMYTFNISVLDKRKSDSAMVIQLVRTPYYFCLLMALFSPFTKLVFYIDAAGYHSGSLYNILYMCAFFYLILSYLVFVVKRKNLARRRERYSLFLYNFIVAIALIIRILMPKLLLMDTFVLMAIIVVYLAFANPEYSLELRGAVFNSRALRDYIEENIGHFRHRCLGVTVHKYHEMRDIYGTKQMDEGLYLIARYLTRTFKGCNVFYYRRGRYIILCSKDSDFRAMCQTIAERFHKAWSSEGVELYLDVGFATIEISNDIDSSDIILNTMVSAMVMADNMDSTVPVEITDTEILQTERETGVKRSLEAAIENNAVEVFLQPLISAEDGTVVGAEALSRIRDPQGKIIPPSIFIPIAENNGRINELGEQMLEKTCKFMQENDLEAMGIKWINVNLSPVQFMRSDLGEKCAAIVSKYDIPPEMIHLEITEESMIDDTFLQKQIQSLESKGFKFVLDDYGTGYSNLSRLKKCPFINIKLDMGLVWDYCKEPDAILPNMINAFRSMNFGITSEGIEDENMAEEMKRLGCDYLQGFFYSKPIPMDEFVRKYSKA